MNTENYPNFLVYPDWLVPLEIAKQLKEIGFNGKCEAYIRDEELSPIYTKAPKKDYNLNCDTISIPSYVQIFDWFEEVKILTAKENTFFKFLIENIEKKNSILFFSRNDANDCYHSCCNYTYFFNVYNRKIWITQTLLFYCY